MNNRRFGALSSSVDPQKLSARVTGAIISASGVIVFVVTYFTGLPELVTPKDVEEIARLIGEVVGTGTVLYGLTQTLYGWLRAKVARWAER